MSKNEYQEFLTMFKNIDNEYSDSENDENKASIFRRLTSPRGSVSSIGKNKINSNIRTKLILNPDLAKSDNVNENNFNTSVSIVQQPNPKESINAAKKMNSIEDQNNEDSGLDSLTASSNNNVQKYNITNLLKHIYSLKSINPSLQSTQSSPSLSHSSLNSIGQNEQQSNAAKQFWMPDEQVKECFQCNEKFTTFRRRHHCRVCGQIFCAKCSDHEIPSQLIWPNTNGNIRACKFCHSFVGEIQTSGTADLKQNSSSIKELMTRLSLPTSSFYSFSSTDNKSTPDTTEATTPTFSLSSFPSTSSLSQSVPNTDKSQSELSDDSNPFDVTENKDYLNKPQSNESELKQLIINNSSELRNLWVQLYHTSDGIQFQTKSINKFKKVYNSISGKELVNWLMKSKSVSKDQAIVIGQALMHGKWLECSYQQNPNQSSYYLNSSSSNNANLVNKFEQVFYDENTFYKPGPSALNYRRDEPMEEKKTDVEEEPDWIKELNKMIGNDQESASSSSSQTNLREAAIASAINDHEEEDQKDQKDQMSEAITMPLIKIETKATPIDNAELINQNIHSGSPSIKSEFFDMEQKTKIPKSLNCVNDNLQKIHRHLHLEILKQMLKLKNLSFEWFDIILSLASQCVDLVRPDVKHDNDSMDIRSYIKIKKLLLQEKSQSRIVNGLVFSKNLAHKNMNNDIKTPKVLLLKSPIEYFNRIEDKMCSLESIFAAESQYLKNYCSKLLIKYQPDILVVEKSVARIAQEIFLQSNVSLVLNVKNSIMDKLSRFLQADPMFSIDDPIRKPKLGFCSRFHVDNYQLKNCDEKQKSLMFFEGTPTNLGCTVLLCGPNENELKIVKLILKFMIYVIYNSKLEASFIMDKYADLDFENTIYESILKNDDSESGNSTKFEADFEKLNQEIDENLSRKTRLISESQPEITEPKPVNPLPISIDQSPLEESNKSVDKSEIEDQETKNNLKLEICEQHKEKNTINLNRNFKLLIDDLHLSCSPFIKFKMPYLLIENTNDPLKKYLPENYMNYLKSNILLLDSHLVTHSIVSPIRPNSDQTVTDDNKQLHEFLLMHLTKSFDDLEIKKLYADFKSRGGVSINNTSQTRRLILKNVENLDQNSNDENQNHFDCLDIFNRQQLAVLYVSQCETSPLYPNICQKPRIINMKFYSENDMTLGSFLARNCFRNGYKCPNDSCGSLIVYHTRSFVHGDTKITIRMSIVPSVNSQNTPQIETPVQSQINKSPVQPMSILSVASLLPKSPQPLRTSTQIQTPVQPTQQSQPQSQPIYDDINIFMWSVCKICNKSTKKVAMSPDTWSFSLAKFLELTLHTQSAYHQFNPDSDHECKHSLFSDNYQYFRFKNIVTVFSASKITLKKLFLPEAELKFFNHAKKRDEYIDEIKDLYEKGLSQYSTLIERLNLLKTLNLSDKQIQKLDKFINQIASDYTLKSKIEKINLILTNNLHDASSNDSPKEVNYTLIDLLMIELKKYLANFSVHWNTKVVEFFNNKKTKSADDDTSNNNNIKAAQSSSYTESIEQGKLSVTNDSSSEYGVSLLADSNHDYEDHMTKSQAPSAISIGKRLIANLIPLSAYQPLKIPFIDDEHYLLSTESSYYVNEKYLSSIVSFTLSSKEYKEYQLNSSKMDIQKFYSAPSQVQQDIDEFDPSQKQSKTNPIHFELQFSDSTTKFYCKAYHAELFSRLRKLLIPNEEDKFINSLFRCVNWEAKGGKSNSQFRKTLDNRFILKEMSKQEVASFIDFAPQYINYLIDSIQNKKASCMAKIYGAYRICMMKNSTISSSKAVKIDVVVMENLFVSNKKSIQIFDLKGSERNRLIQTGQTDQSQNHSDNVLLDENFLRWSFDNPIYVKPHSKYVLMKAIENDSKFLSSKYIMDYSLLCGIDMETNEINVGLIDYLRAFTWDKKVETYIKSTIGGAQGKMPTIVSPEIYKTRFINAIDRYFQQVPDQWYKDNSST
ncbi:unnamed protein product [Brachionus calyciflorus]|uniref:1-phosphatidylinositol-3-phosphate 5-kinase n=1 Tax=Brachionus calyciflorus TaxID=104777 RepID=A0A813NEN8_9BILA|nr:unnamed protein product [Brachionus calyciflorus]